LPNQNKESRKMKLQVTKSSPVWQKIIADNKEWFSKSTLEFFKSTIFWSSLKETEQGLKFVTSEWDYQQETKVFTIRLVTDRGIETISLYGEYSSLIEALRAL
jgi:hypothetical protein